MNLIVNELAKDGVLEPSGPFESPCTGHAPTDRERFLPDADVEVSVDTVHNSKRSAFPREVA